MHIPIISSLVQQYEEALPYADPRTRDWFLLWRSPVYVWALSAAYLAMVIGGPRLMANRKPFQLQGFLVVYNLLLVALSVYMALEMILSTYNAGYNYICDAYSAETRKNPAELRVANVFWWYFFSKAIEFMDTALMVLRKKNNQITFLHVYHHVSMFNIWWWVMMFIPGGLTWFGACINSMVHVVMYLYYGLSAIPSLREKLWWKKYLTRFQLIQFVITLSHSTSMLFTTCAFPLWGKLLLVGYMITMLVLFSNFYIRAYIMRKPRHKVAPSLTMAKDTTAAAVANGSTVYNGSATGEALTQRAVSGQSGRNGVMNGKLNGYANGQSVTHTNGHHIRAVDKLE